MDDWHGRTEIKSEWTLIEIVLAAIAILVVLVVCIFGPAWTVLHWH